MDTVVVYWAGFTRVMSSTMRTAEETLVVMHHDDITTTMDQQTISRTARERNNNFNLSLNKQIISLVSEDCCCDGAIETHYFLGTKKEIIRSQ